MSAVRAPRASILLVPVLVIVLSGCSVGGTVFHPGIAAVVGDRTVTTEHADQTTSGYCTAISEELERQGQRIPQRYVSAEVVAKLAIRLAVEQLAEEYDVEPTDQYRSEHSTLRTQVTGVSEEATEAFVEVASAVPYYRDILITVGGIELEEQGVTDASTEERFAAGQEPLTRWITRNEIEFNPRYGLEIQDGLPVQADTDTSYAFGDDAKAGLGARPDPEYAAGLPDRLVCG